MTRRPPISPLFPYPPLSRPPHVPPGRGAPRRSREVPTVLLNCYSEDGTWASVVPDEVSGGCTATEVLLSKGHERVGFINLPPVIPAAVGRLQGYKRALEARGLPFDEIGRAHV